MEQVMRGVKNAHSIHELTANIGECIGKGIPAFRKYGERIASWIFRECVCSASIVARTNHKSITRSGAIGVVVKARVKDKIPQEISRVVTDSGVPVETRIVGRSKL